MSILRQGCSGSGGDSGSIFYCPRCNTEETYCDSTNRIFCPRCGNYVKDQELR